MHDEYGEDFFRALIDYGGNYIAVVDPDGTFRYVSPSNDRLTGLMPEEMKGRISFELVHPDDAPAILETFQELLRQPGASRRMECRIRGKSGDWPYIQLEGTNLLDHPAVRGIVINTRDITERKRAEEELRAKEGQLSYIYSNVSEVIYYLSVERDERFRFLSVNQSFLDVTGLSEDQVVGKYVDEVIPEPSLSLVLTKYRQAMRDNEAVKWEEVTDYPAGRKYGEVVITPVCDGNGVCTNLVGSVHDLTERVAMEESLRESEERYRGFFENASIGITHTLPEGRFLRVNPAFAAMLGYASPEELISTITDIPGQLWVDAKQRSEIVGDILKRDDWDFNEVDIYRKDGGRIRVYMTARRVLKPDGTLAYLEAFVEDITERRRAEAALVESEEKFRILSDQSLMGIHIMQDDRVKYVNQAVADICGCSIEEMMAWEPDEYASFVHPNDLPIVLEQMRKKQAGGEDVVTTYEWRMITRSGEIKWIQSFSKTIHYGEELADFVMMTDITDRKRTMERLEKLNQCFLSLGADPRENVEKVLRVGQDILGAYLLKYCCRSRSVQYHCSDSGTRSGLLTKEAGRCYLLDAGLAEGPGFMADLERIPPEERLHDIAGLELRSLLAVPVRMGEDPIGSLCLFDTVKRDFTMEERELLMMLARAVGIEEDRFHHEETLRDFIDIASHELRHPITIMKGYSLILKEQGDKIDEGTKDVILSIIDHGADRLDNLVGGLLDISHIERGKFEVKREMHSLGPIIARAIEEMGARGFSNDFASRLPGDLKSYRVDEGKFSELMVILLENAVKYSPSGSLIEVELGEDEECVVVSVLDRGMGVSEEDREHVFDRFFQVEEVIHHSTPGMGMGLYIARNIVEAHGGRIWCEPRPGGGTAFSFTISRVP